MQAVILAAGKGLRLRPLTLTKPKPLLKVGNKSILEHNLDQLNNVVKEVILVIGYKGELIKKQIGSSYKNLKIKYVVQKKISGTGNAAKETSHLLKGKFILLYGDDIYDKKDIKKCLKKNPCILLKKVKNPSAFGQIVTKGALVKNLVEKPKKPVSNLVNTGLYFLDKSIFDFKIKKSSRGEYEFTDYLKKLIKKEKLFFEIADDWTPVSFKMLLKENKNKNMKIILDLDHTLFRSTKFYEALEGNLEKLGVKKNIYKKTYETSKGKNKMRRISKQLNLIAKNTEFNLKELKKISEKTLKQADQFLYPDVISFLNKTSKKFKLFILSFGEDELQRKKIKHSGINNYFQKIIITQNITKAKKIKKILKKGETALFIDDNPDAFLKTKQIFPDLITIRINRGEGRYHNNSNNHKVDYTIKNLEELECIIKL